MIAYIDTSALAKRYILETGSDSLRKLFEEIEYLEASALTELELIALFERAKKEHCIDSPTYRKMIHYFERDIRENTVSLVNVQNEDWKTARRLIQQRRLRVADAIQLACAIHTHRRFSGDIYFICSDHELLQAARLEGIKGINPAKNR